MEVKTTLAGRNVGGGSKEWEDMVKQINQVTN